MDMLVGSACRGINDCRKAKNKIDQGVDQGKYREYNHFITIICKLHINLTTLV